MKFIYAGGAGLALAATAMMAAQSTAQSNRKEPLGTIEEVAACMTMGDVIKDLQRKVEADNRWLDDAAKNRSVSQRTYYKRQDGNIARANIVNDLLANFNAACTSGKKYVHLRQLCTTRQRHAFYYIYDSSYCVEYRRDTR